MKLLSQFKLQVLEGILEVCPTFAEDALFTREAVEAEVDARKTLTELDLASIPDYVIRAILRVPPKLPYVKVLKYRYDKPYILHALTLVGFGWLSIHDIQAECDKRNLIFDEHRLPPQEVLDELRVNRRTLTGVPA